MKTHICGSSFFKTGYNLGEIFFLRMKKTNSAPIVVQRKIKGIPIKG